MNTIEVKRNLTELCALAEISKKHHKTYLNRLIEDTIIVSWTYDRKTDVVTLNLPSDLEIGFVLASEIPMEREIQCED